MVILCQPFCNMQLVLGSILIGCDLTVEFAMLFQLISYFGSGSMPRWPSISQWSSKTNSPLLSGHHIWWKCWIHECHVPLLISSKQRIVSWSHCAKWVSHQRLQQGRQKSSLLRKVSFSLLSFFNLCIFVIFILLILWFHRDIFVVRFIAFLKLFEFKN